MAPMTETFKQKGVATVEDLRSASLDSRVKLVECEMTMDVFGFTRDPFIDGTEVGGAATFLEFASGADMQLFI